MGNLSKARVRDIVSVSYRALEGSCGQHHLERQLEELYATCERQEKQHLAFGARLLGRKPKRQQPLEVTARYFTVKAVATYETAWRGEKSVLATLAELCDLRSDYQLGAMLAAKLRTLGSPYGAIEAFASLDYSVHFATRE